MSKTPPSSNNLEQARKLADGLTRLERELFLGKSEGWGSWMMGVAQDLCAKGIGRRDGRGSIYFDTPLAEQVRSELTRKDTGA